MRWRPGSVCSGRQFIGGFVAMRVTVWVGWWIVRIGRSGVLIRWIQRWRCGCWRLGVVIWSGVLAGWCMRLGGSGYSVKCEESANGRDALSASAG